MTLHPNARHGAEVLSPWAQLQRDVARPETGAALGQLRPHRIDALDALGNGDERYFALALRLLTKRGKS